MLRARTKSGFLQCAPGHPRGAPFVPAGNWAETKGPFSPACLVPVYKLGPHGPRLKSLSPLIYCTCSYANIIILPKKARMRHARLITMSINLVHKLLEAIPKMLVSHLVPRLGDTI
jgi:hypothetical protein